MGGTFSNRPASVKSNISNGAYGIFHKCYFRDISLSKNTGFDGEVFIIAFFYPVVELSQSVVPKPLQSEDVL